MASYFTQMNQKEKKEIGLNMTMLMESILDENSQSEDVANTAINFAADMLKMFPEVRQFVESSLEDDWDKNVAWINWERQFIS